MNREKVNLPRRMDQLAGRPLWDPNGEAKPFGMYYDLDADYRAHMDRYEPRTGVYYAPSVERYAKGELHYDDEFQHAFGQPPRRRAWRALLYILLAFVLGFVISYAAHARSLEDRIRTMPDEAWVGVGFMAADHAATGYCAHNRTCVEKGPIIKGLCGSRPKPLCLAGAFAAKSLLSLGAISLVQDKDPRLARNLSLGLAAGSATSFGITATVAF